MREWHDGRIQVHAGFRRGLNDPPAGGRDRLPAGREGEVSLGLLASIATEVGTDVLAGDPEDIGAVRGGGGCREGGDNEEQELHGC